MPYSSQIDDSTDKFGRVTYLAWKASKAAFEIRMYTPSYYIDRAAELESLAKGITDLATRTMCLELAQRFRDIAQMKSMTNPQSDKEALHLAERMVGKTPSPDKH